MKRFFDLVAASAGLVLAAPLFLLVAAAVKASSPGPVFYVARRAGRDGRPFGMVKFRTMHRRPDQGALITAPGDVRVFPLGRFLRRSKLDELPQLWNVLKGDMSIVGPRPEDPAIVRDHYTPWMHETLAIRPGLTSPGAVFGYLHEDDYLDPADPEGSYVARLMPAKLAIERVYLDRMSFARDLGVIRATVSVVASRILGLRWQPDLPERQDSLRYLGDRPPNSR